MNDEDLRSGDPKEEKAENNTEEKVRTEDGGGKTGKPGKRSGFAVAGIIFIAVVILSVAVLAARRIFFIKEEVDVTPLSTVSVFNPQRGSVEIETSLIGTKMPGDIYYAVPKVVGEITEIYVKKGDRVKKDDKICEIDNKKQIDAARLSLEGAEVKLRTVNDSIELAKTNLDRMRALYESGDVSAQSYEQVKSSYDQAVAGLEGAKIEYEGAKLQYDTQVEFATVTAPADGIIESADMTVNVIATQQSPVAIISAEGSGKIQMNVTDRLLSSVHEGDTVRIEKLGETYEGTVTQVASMPGQTTGLYQVDIEIDDGGAISTGASAKVYFVSERSDDALTVPTGCIYYDGGHTYVYTVSYESSEDSGETASVLEGNRAATVHKVEVTTGISDRETTEILTGITESDEVIRTWTAQLYEGARVQVLGGGVR